MGSPRYVRAHIVTGGNQRKLGEVYVQHALFYMATVSAVRWDPVMKAHYQQLRERGKVAKVALVACMRKLLTIVNARRRDELMAGASMAA